MFNGIRQLCLSFLDLDIKDCSVFCCWDGDTVNHAICLHCSVDHYYGHGSTLPREPRLLLVVPDTVSVRNRHNWLTSVLYIVAVNYSSE